MVEPSHWALGSSRTVWPEEIRLHCKSQAFLQICPPQCSCLATLPPSLLSRPVPSCPRQRTEVVEPASVSWDLGGFIAPAIERMKQLFRAKQSAASAAPYSYGYGYGAQQGEAGAEGAVGGPSRQASGEADRWEESGGKGEGEGYGEEEEDEEEEVFDVDDFLRARLPAEFERISGQTSERAWRR